MAAIKEKSVVDTTGCGDVFCAGAAVSLSKGLDPYESALYGMEIASAAARLSGISEIFKLMIP